MKPEKRAAIVRCLVEGNSIRSTSRMTGACKEAITRLLCELGTACLEYQDQALRELPCERIQCDEAWSFCFKKESHLKPGDKEQGRGDAWVWTAICPVTKLIACWRVGLREPADAFLFMEDLSSRLSKRIQLTTDGLGLYRPAIEAAFGHEVDYGMEIKTYGQPLDQGRIEARYSPSRCTDVKRTVLIGKPAQDLITTSHNERNNLTMRMGMRRFTRLTNAFSKKIENHAHAVNLHMMHYNFARVHQTIRCTPAMEAGISDHVWSIEEVVDLLK